MPDIRMTLANETFARAFCMTQLGKEPPFPWTDKEFIMNGNDVAAYFDYFNKVPKGVLLPPEETALIKPQVAAPISVRRTFLHFDYTGTFAMTQSQTKDDLVMIEYPNNRKGKGAAVAARPGLVKSVFSKSKNKALAFDFLGWLANDPEAGKILKTVRGVLPSSRQVEAVLADPGALSVVDKKVFAITNAVYAKPVCPFSPGPLIGNIWDETHFMRIGQGVAFGRMTPAEAGRQFDQMVKDALP